MRSIPHQRGLACMALGTILALYAAAAFAEDPTVEQLQQEMKAMKAQFEQMQQKLKQQDELIQKLSKEKAAAPPVTTPAAAAAAATPASEEQLKQDVKDDVMREIQPSLQAANKTFPSQFNPAIGLIIDTVGSYQENGGGNFEFRSAEIGMSASIDPFARGYAIINGNADEVRGRGGGDRHHLVAVQPHGEGRPLLRRLRPPVEVPRPRPAVRQPADRARRVRRRRVAGRRPRAQLPDAARPVPDLHRSAPTTRSAPRTPRRTTSMPRAARRVHLPLPAVDVHQLQRRQQRRRRRLPGRTRRRSNRTTSMGSRCSPTARRASSSTSTSPTATSRSPKPATAASSGAPSSSTTARASTSAPTPTRCSAARTPSASTATSSRASPAALPRLPLPVGAADRRTGRRHPGLLAVPDHLGLGVPAHPPRSTRTWTRPGTHENQFFLQWTAILGSHVHGFRDR